MGVYGDRKSPVFMQTNLAVRTNGRDECKISSQAQSPFQSDYQSKIREEESKLLLGEDMLRYCISGMKVSGAVGGVPWQCNSTLAQLVERSFLVRVVVGSIPACYLTYQKSSPT